MECVEAEGRTIDDAIARALAQLGATRDRVEVEILNNAVRGFLGFGARRARVRATLRAPLAPPGPTRSADGSGRGADTDRRERVVSLPAAADKPAARLHGDEPPAATAAIVTEPARAAEHVAWAAAERAAALMREVIQHLGVTAVVTLTRTDDGEFLLDLSGDASGILIGRRGQMLDALEYLMNRVVAHDGGESARIIVDVENYRARRREALESMARRSALEAKEKQKPITLNPMNPRDRRIVHMALQDDPSLVTRSAGVGYLRKLVVMPAGADRRRRSGGRRPQP